MAPYPGRYEAARTKGVAPNEEIVPLDVTGTWDLQVEIDEIARIIERSPVPDGGLSCDMDSRTAVVRLVAPVDGTSADVERLKWSILEAAESFVVKFVSVNYSRAELEELSDQLFFTLDEWRPSEDGLAGGGWDCYLNRVVVLIADGTEGTQGWIDALSRRQDNRIAIRLFTPIRRDPRRR